MKQILTLCCILSLAACATPYQQRTATQGAVIGATAGAVIGHQSGNAAEGAMIGGALGALAGAVIAEERQGRIQTSEPRYHRRACRQGRVYFNKAHQAHRLDRKIHLLKKGLRYCPNNPAAHNDLGVALVLRGDRAAARIRFNHALRIDPGYQPARYNLRKLGYRYHNQQYRRYDRQKRYRDRYKDKDKDYDEHGGWKDSDDD
ncbi:MAG: glycine zipper domain-containing protein [Mariprofundus sp.]